MKVAMKAHFTFFGQIKKAGKWFIAYCPPLDLTTQGRTEKEAKDNLIEASEFFLISCLERGTLDQALRELGFVPLKEASFSQKPARKGAYFSMDIPIPFGCEKNLQCRHV